MTLVCFCSIFGCWGFFSWVGWMETEMESGLVLLGSTPFYFFSGMCFLGYDSFILFFRPGISLHLMPAWAHTAKDNGLIFWRERDGVAVMVGSV